MNNQLKALITNKSQAITHFLDYEQILAKDYTEYHDGDGYNKIYPYNLPVNSITSIHISSDWDFDTESLVASGSYRIVNKQYVALKNTVFTKGEQNVQLIYNAGFETIPSDLKQVCIDEVIRAYNDKENIAVVSRTDPKGTVTKLEKGFMKQSLQVLNRYKKLMIL